MMSYSFTSSVFNVVNLAIHRTFPLYILSKSVYHKHLYPTIVNKVFEHKKEAVLCPLPALFVMSILR